MRIILDVDDAYYYEMLSDLVGESIESEYQLLATLREMACSTLLPKIFVAQMPSSPVSASEMN